MNFEHLYEDDQYQSGRSPVDGQDVLKIIADNDQHAYDWIRQIEDSEALYHFLIIVAKGRHKPEYRELVKMIIDEIEGFL
jgi:hypothetical protein